MIKTLLVAAAALVATPAVAQTNANFVGPRIEVNAGSLDVDNDDVSYGAALGFDSALTNNVTLGGEINTANTFDDNARELGAAARLGVAVHPNALVYGRAGYTTIQLDNAKDLDGLDAGAGVELKLNRNLFTGLEYRYGNFDRGYDRHGLVARLGFRF